MVLWIFFFFFALFFFAIITASLHIKLTLKRNESTQGLSVKTLKVGDDSDDSGFTSSTLCECVRLAYLPYLGITGILSWLSSDWMLRLVTSCLMYSWRKCRMASVTPLSRLSEGYVELMYCVILIYLFFQNNVVFIYVHLGVNLFFLSCSRRKLDVNKIEVESWYEVKLHNGVVPKSFPTPCRIC